ncbi:MFS transporter [uncultured Amnibacterium sp.]|uniref:MFS transporter n=1 Tax=uncultured Amnibacterium sp. TaxID=1631851 RepID=UPI0035CB6CFF
MTTAATTATTAMQRRLLWAAILAAFVSFLDGSIVNIALPAIERDFGGGVVVQQWVVDGYLLTLSALILAAGAVSDAFGRLRVLRIAVVAFTVTSLVCALAPTAGLLIAARVLQGVAGALLVPGSLALIVATFQGAAQSAAIGRWTGWTSVSFLAGPVAGGVFVDAIGWRWVFVLGALPAAGALLLLGRIADGQRDGPRPRVDVTGAALAALGLAGLTAALIEAHLGLTDPRVLAALIGGAVSLAAFLIRDARSTAPLVPLELFRRGNFAAGNAATLFLYAGVGLATLIPTVFLQEVVHLTAFQAALTALPATVLSIVLSGRFGALAGRYGPRLFMTLGPIVASAGFALMTFSSGDRGALWFVVPGTVLFGLGFSATVAPLTSAVLGAVPAIQSGIGSAVNNAIARVAGLVATACAGLILGLHVDVGGFHRGVLVIAVLLVLGGIVSAIGVRNPLR